MAFDPDLALRLEQVFASYPISVQENLIQKKMFGGIAYLFHGKMTVGIIKDELMVRVVASKMPEILEDPFTRVMDFTGKPMKEFVYVEPAGFQEESRLREWIDLGLEHARTKLGTD